MIKWQIRLETESDNDVKHLYQVLAAFTNVEAAPIPESKPIKRRARQKKVVKEQPVIKEPIKRRKRVAEPTIVQQPLEVTNG